MTLVSRVGQIFGVLWYSILFHLERSKAVAFSRSSGLRWLNRGNYRTPKFTLLTINFLETFVHALFLVSTKINSNVGSIDSRDLEQLICSGFKVLCTPKFYINFKIRGECEFVISEDSNWYKSIQTSSHLFIYKNQEVQRKSLSILFRVTSMLRQFLWVVQIVTFASINSNSIKIPNNNSRLLQVMMEFYKFNIYSNYKTRLQLYRFPIT